MPEVPAWFVLGLLALVADRQMGLLDEGCPGFVLPIEARYRSLGGTVQYGSTVETILVEDGRAVGVRLRDGTEHRADVVVSAADGRTTIFGMLGGSYVDADTRRRYETWQVIRPTVMVSLGVTRTFADQPHLLQLLLASPIEMGPERIAAMSVRIFNYGAAFAPAGKTVVQAMMEVDWDYWESLRDAGGTVYAEAKTRVAGDVIDRLERRFPGIAGQVEMVDVATPLHHLALHAQPSRRLHGLDAHAVEPDDADQANASRPAGFLHGRPMGGAGRERAGVPVLRSPRCADPVSPGPSPIHRRRRQSDGQRLSGR